jgi:hypothetical protein
LPSSLFISPLSFSLYTATFDLRNTHLSRMYAHTFNLVLSLYSVQLHMHSLITMPCQQQSRPALSSETECVTVSSSGCVCVCVYVCVTASEVCSVLESQSDSDIATAPYLTQ